MNRVSWSEIIKQGSAGAPSFLARASKGVGSRVPRGWRGGTNLSATSHPEPVSFSRWGFENCPLQARQRAAVGLA